MCSAFPSSITSLHIAAHGHQCTLVRALWITIGEGAGHNWFCVLYPSLCVLDEDDYAGDDLPCYSEVWAWLSKRIGGAA